MSHTTLKRDIHPVLKTLLNWDVEVSKKFVKFVDMNFGPISKYNGLLKTLEISCHGIPWFIGLVITVLLIGFSSVRGLCVNLFFSLLIDVAMTAVVKASARRRRPSDNPNDMFATFAMDKFSFPSGHSSRAVMLFFLLLRQYYFLFLLLITVFIWCVAVCLSRILMRRHYVLDVVGGSFLGFFEAMFILNYTWLSLDSSNALLKNFFWTTFHYI
ncbi:UNVERIFIED_CONTAM: hypothetical protein RMT77_009363 [Armadillidium vulgare]